MAIKQGDIVGSNGRIETIQDGSCRFIEFERAIVLEVEPELITVNPIGKQAVLICRRADLRFDDDEDEPEAEPEPWHGLPVETHEEEPEGTIEIKGAVEPEQPKAKPSLREVQAKAAAKKPAARSKPAAKKRAARRRKPS